MPITRNPRRHFLAIPDLSKQEISHIIDTAFAYKNNGEHGKLLDGHTVTLAFEKPSLRTRISFEVAISALGGHTIFQSGTEIFQRADGDTRESIEDITHVLERYCSAIVARVHSHDSLLKMATCSSIPIVNALSDEHHPMQALADLMTIYWHKPERQDVKVVYIGDGNNVATSLMHICTLMGLHFVHAGPEAFQIPKAQWAIGKTYARANNTICAFTTDLEKAVQDADVLYTDTFVSMGDEEEAEKRLRIFVPYQISVDVLKKAKSDAVFLHCLPAHRNEEVVSAVIDSPQSKVFDLAECRMHTAKALLTFLFTPERMPFETEKISATLSA